MGIGSVLYLLMGGAGVIRRTAKVCYPMPPEVEEGLLRNGNLTELDNIEGPDNSETMGTYCVRCLVWRPPKKWMMDAHHCSTCQRCVKGFDHHCGVFGRCIVRGNMSCFALMLGMLPAGIVTTVLALAVLAMGDGGKERVVQAGVPEMLINLIMV